MNDIVKFTEIIKNRIDAYKHYYGGGGTSRDLSITTNADECHVETAIGVKLHLKLVANDKGDYCCRCFFSNDYFDHHCPKSPSGELLCVNKQKQIWVDK
jgi:hypothetical protein